MVLVWSVRLKFSSVWGFFLKKKKTPQRIKETNQLETEKKVIHEISSFYAVKWCWRRNQIWHSSFTPKSFPRGKEKKKNSCGAKWRPPLGRKNPDGLAVFSARWILAAGGAAITPAAESLHLAVPFSQQASKAAAVDGWNRREREKVLCREKSVWSKESSVLLRGGVFFFSSSLFSLSLHVHNKIICQKYQKSTLSESGLQWSGEKIVYICMFGRKRNKGLGVWPLTWEYQWGIGALRDVTDAEFHNNSNSKNYFQEVFWSEK